MRVVTAILLLAIGGGTNAETYWVLRSYAAADNVPGSNDTIAQPEKRWDLDSWNADGVFCVRDSSTGKCIGVTAASACKIMRDRYALQASMEAKEAGKPSRYSFKCRYVTVYTGR
jgi:hypothetical protein